MKGSFFSVMKRWVVAALVFTLGLSLTSCGSKKQLLNGSDLFTCDSDNGNWQFDVQLQAMNDTNYTLMLSPVTVTANQYGGAPSGDVGLGAPNDTPEVIATQLALQPGRVIRLSVTTDQLSYFPYLIIQPHQPGVAFDQVNSDDTAICELPPIPGIN